jgi:hypothetical protein
LPGYAVVVASACSSRIVSLSRTEFPFAIDKQTGELFARGFIDRESKENYNFEVTVSIILFVKHSCRSRHYTLVIFAHGTLSLFL